MSVARTKPQSQRRSKRRASNAAAEEVPARRYGNVVSLGLTLFAAALGTAAIAGAVYLMYSLHTTFPYWDHWGPFEMAFRPGGISWWNLWEPHNEHRMPLPKLYFFGDILLFRGTNVSLKIVMLLHLAFATVLLAWINWTKRRSWSESVLFGGLTAGLLFSPMHTESFVAPFQLTFVMVMTGAVAACCSLALFGTNKERYAIAASCAAAVFAALSSANGLVVWPVILVTLLAMRRPWREIAWFSVVAGVFVACYLPGLGRVSGGALSTVISHPWQALEYVFAYLGGSWIHLDSVAICAAVGVSGVTIFGVLAARSVLAPKLDPQNAALVALGCFSIGTAVMTAGGRAIYGTYQATTSRYQFFAVLLWIAIGGLVLHLGKEKQRRIQSGAVATILLLFVLPPLLRVRKLSYHEYQRVENFRNAEAAIVSGLEARHFLLRMFPDPEFPVPVLARMRAAGAAAFGTFPRTGTPLASEYPNPGGCADLNSRIEPVRDIGRFGFAIHGKFRSAGPSLRLIVAQDDRIVGFGRSQSGSSEWVAYVPGTFAGHDVTVFREFDGKRICRVLSTRLNIPGSAYFQAAAPSIQSLVSARLGLFREGLWWEQVNGPQAGREDTEHRADTFGQPGDLPIAGPWKDGNELHAGVFRQGAWLVDTNGNGRYEPDSDENFRFGEGGDIPVVGDWDGSGKLRVGSFRRGEWHLDMDGDRRWTSADRTTMFGKEGDIPVVGDWDGTGTLRIGVFRRGTWILDTNANLKEDPGDRRAAFGESGDIPVVGNWDGHGTLRIGVFRRGELLADINGNFRWDNETTDIRARIGQPDDIPVFRHWGSTTDR